MPPVFKPSPFWSAHGAAWMPLLVFAVTWVTQWLLWSNPGYFSHDEFQWAARALPANGEPTQWVGWFDVQAFQFRPLTFNLWLWLSRQLFDQPQAFHTVIVAAGAANAALLGSLLHRFGASLLAALGGALVFALSPYAVFVHGWVGTIGDLLWVGCALAMGWLATLHAARAWMPVLGAAVLTAIALTAKESALSIGALLVVACVLDPNRRSWRWMLLGAAVPSAAYLLMRFGVLGQVADSDVAYAWSLSNLPQRWLEYQVYIPHKDVFEAHNTLAGGWSSRRLLAAGLLWLALIAAVGSAGWRWALALVAGGLAALGPVLVLAGAGNQYGYGFAAFTAGLVACAWPRVAGWARAVILIVALSAVWHGVNVMRQMRAVGDIQAVFTPALITALSRAPTATLRLQTASDAEAWIFQRLTQLVPRVGDVAIGDRVRMTGPTEPVERGLPDYLIEADGRLTPLR